MAKRKKWKIIIVWIVVLAIIFLPRLIIQFSINQGMEIYGRFIGISAITLFAPLFFLFVLWFSYLEKNENNHKNTKANSKSLIIIRIIVLVTSVMGFYFLTFNYLKDAYYIIHHEIPIISGKAENVYRPGRANLIFSYQSYGIDSPERKYSSFFSSEIFSEGDTIKIWYLPNSRMVLKAEKVIKN